MKNWIYALALTTGTMNATPDVISLHQVTQTEMNGLHKHLMQGKILCFEEGLTINVQGRIFGELVEMETDSSLPLIVKKTFYLKFSGNEFLFSKDGSEWVPLLTFITGQAGGSLQLVDGALVLDINCEANIR